MIDISKDIHSLTDFKRNTREHVERLQATGRPEVLTVNGKAQLVVQDAEAYQRLLADADEADVVRTLRKRIEDGERGVHGRRLREVIQELAKEAGIALDEP